MKSIYSFDERLKENAATGCLEWQAGRDAYGYGRLFFNGRQERSHRVAWIRAHGAIPAGMHVCHRCDNPPCCNPDHLFLGSNTDNRRDSVRKGRAPRGELQGNSKLTRGDIERVRDIARVGNRSQREIASYFDMSQKHVSRVIRGDAWRHV